MKTTCLLVCTMLTAALHAQSEDLVRAGHGGGFTLNQTGASYFAKLSLNCSGKAYPHFYYEELTSADDLKLPEEFWPAFYGCYDWHSAVHNHWALIKLLKTFPGIPEADSIRRKLDISFSAENILQEKEYFISHSEDEFEFPYGTSWLLKVAEELYTWDDADSKKWLVNLDPLINYIVNEYCTTLPAMDYAVYSGNHGSTAFGLSFALDYARTVKNDTMAELIENSAREFYSWMKSYNLGKEPYGYDFMSCGLLIADLMRKVLLGKEFKDWLKDFSPELFTVEGVQSVLAVKRQSDHSDLHSHWDGFQLNRIWCLNGILEALPVNALPNDVELAWRNAQKDMWDYAQESIGVGNYDVDHWLSSFSVFAMLGY